MISDPASAVRRSRFRPVIRLDRRAGILAAALLLGLCAVGAYQFGRASVYRHHPGLAETDQAAAILANVGRIIQLPVGEAPSIATIKDAAAARTLQPFLEPAQAGDVLIVYPGAQIALLYRPANNKLIAVGPVTIPPTAVSASPVSPSIAASVTSSTTTPKNATTSKSAN